jgi:ABC-type uncharacterized transport system substrate-binding protein
MRRREFITLLGGVASVWPFVARGQQPDRMRRVGVLMAPAEYHPLYRRRFEAFLQRLRQLGWIEGGNMHIDYRWGNNDADRIRRFALELVALAPDVIVSHNSTTTGPLLQATRTIPIVFVTVADPVGAGFVDDLSRPGAMRPALIFFNTTLPGSCWNCLRKSPPVCCAWHS